MIPMGKLLRQLRKQQKWTQEVLAVGVSSKTVVSRIENGSTEPDVFLLDTLVNRLGQSLRFFEIVVTDTAYEILQLRMDIKESMSLAEFEKATARLEKYEQLVSEKAELHRNYIEEVRTAIEKKQCEPELYGLENYKLVISENELIRDIRRERGLSQEQLSENVCARETVSCMEHGRKPNPKTWKKLMNKLGELHYTYYGYVVANEFSTYELVERYRKEVKENREEAKKLLKEIKKRLDITQPVNRQFVESSELIEKLYERKLSPAAAMAGLEKTLRYTMPEYDGNIQRIPYCEEVEILKAVIYCLKKVGRREAAETLEKKLQSKVRKKLKVS